VLPNNARLRQRQRFPLIYHKGQRLTSPLLVLYWIQIPEDEVQQGQWAIVVSKKVSRQAVVRNRIKRLIRSSLRTFLLDLDSGYWGIIIARSSILKVDWQRICGDLTTLFQGAGLLKKD